MRTRDVTRSGSVLGAVLVAVLVLSGCVGVGGGGRGFGSFGSQRSSGSQPTPPDDRSAFRSIPVRSDSAVDILTPGNLYELYSEILETYVDPVDSATLIEGALKGIRAGAVEHGVSPLDSDMFELMTVRASRDPDRDWAQFAGRYEAYLDKTMNRIRPWPVGQSAARGMLDALGDPNSTYLDRKAVEAQQRGEADIGVTLAIGAQSGSPIVREVIAGSLADAARVRPGDTVVAVDGNSTTSMTLSEATQAIRGANGTRVQLTIRSQDESGTHDVTITRASLSAAPVVAEARDGIEYVKVRRLQDGVARAVQNALVDSAQGGARGWVIDLRATSSGSIQEVMDLASLFVGSRVIGAVVDRSQRPQPIRAQGTLLDPRLPTVVLIDGDTGSGAEILVAALKEYQAAIVVGAQTAGRVGLSQVVQLPDGSAAQITSQRILTASGSRLDGVGIEPDYAVESSVEDWVQGRDPQLARAMALLRDVSPES